MKKVFLLIILSVILIFTLLAAFFYPRSDIVHVQEMEVSLQVSDYLGLNLDSDSLKFGTTAQGNSVRRNVQIINPFNMNLQVFVDFSGEMEEWLVVDDARFFLGKDDVKNLSVRVFVPDDAEIGNYTSSMRVVMKKK